MLKQPERESRNVNDLFYEMEGRQIQKMNKVLADVELTKAEEKTLIWLAGWEESTVDHLLSVNTKNEQGTGRRGADKSRGKNPDMACRMGRKYRRSSAVSYRKNSPDTGR